jgi:organic hydroperoxide reductase OsmC/OhrA
VTTVHEYRAELSWTGSTGAGYRSYDRTHTVTTPPAQTELVVTADPTFLGDASLLNPEQLLTASASSCQMLSFLALAALAQVDVIAYRDSATAFMPMRTTRIETIVLKPRITVRAPAGDEQIIALVHKAHDDCFIARSLNTDIKVEPEIEVVEAGD